MSSQTHENSYQEISFNKQATEDESNHHSDYDTFNTQNTSKEKNFESMILRIKELQEKLRKEKEKSSQLQKRNQQLTNMLVSASQSSVKRNQHFIKEVQRKICNFKAVKDLSSSSFRGMKENEEKEPVMRMMTEAGYESSKKLSMTNRQGYQSRSKFDSNKENSNHLNDRLKTETDKFSKSKYTSHDGNNINLMSKSPILSPFAKNVDIRTFNKLENKLMRI